MRFFCFLLLAAASLQGATQSNANPGVISGTVVRPDGMTGIADVQILIVGPLTGPAANAAITMPFMIEEIADGAGMPKASAITNSDGRFEFKNLAIGQYAIRVQREGYFNAAGDTLSAQSIVLNATTPVIDLRVPMMRGATISGRVRDSAGQPIPNASVATYRIGYQNGREILESVNSKSADDRGEYRLFWLQPDEYYVGAAILPPGQAPTQIFLSPSGSIPSEQLFRTFYPGVQSARAASRLKIKEGDSLPGIDINMAPKPAMKVSGRIINTLTQANGQPEPTPANFYLMPRDATALNLAAVPYFRNMSQVNGEFEIRGVPPGSYDLVTTLPDSNGRAFPGRVSIEVGNQDLQGVTLSIHPGAEIKARIFLDGKLIPAAVPPAPQTTGTVPGGIVTAETLRAQIIGAPSTGPRLQFRSKDLYYSVFDSVASAGVRADAEGAYVYPSVPEGAYSLNATGIPANAYVADIRSGDKSVYDNGIVVGDQPPAPIDVMLSSGVQSIRGTVRSVDGKPAVGAMVVLVPPPARRQNVLLYRNVRSLITGEFTIANVPPGNYKLFAWETVPNTAFMNAAFIAKFESLGREISVAAGGTLSFELPVIPRN